MRVIIVEDDPIISSDLGQIVADLGHEVCAFAANAEEARRQAAAMQPDVMFVDFNLEGATTGLSAAASIRALQAVDIVFVTGQADELMLFAIRESEPLAIIEKPYTRAQVRDALARSAHA